jgi:AhpD family alkylhydroperoxidase
MTARLEFATASPDAYQAMLGLEQAARTLPLDATVRHLIKLRTSQINGCAFCIDMHARELREHGEAEHRVWALSAWRETTMFDERERAALALAEEMALLPGGHGVSDAVYDEAARLFPPDELLAILWTGTAINAWNRICVSTRAQPAGREPRLETPAAATTA